LLRAPTLLHDYHTLENAIGDHLRGEVSAWHHRLPAAPPHWWYRLGLERGYFDSLLDEYLVYPFTKIFRWCDNMERYWTDLLSGGHSRESDEVEPRAHVVEELRL
jgi:NAD(P)H-quinone oxidoreductase subunit 5